MRIVRQGERFCEAEVGDLTVTALRDGFAMMPLERLRGPGDRDLTGADLAGVPQPGGKLRLEVMAYLVRGAGEVLLIDTGAADAWQDTTGRLMQALAEAGVGPDAVTQVALTHTHVDHLSGLVGAGGLPAFPQARRILVPVEELGLFRAEARMVPVLDLVLPLEQGDGPMPGVVAVNAPGHEAGHMAFLVEGRLMIWGDVVHVPHLQFARPEVTWGFDTDQAMARDTRLRLMERAVEDGLIVAGAHHGFPPFGRVTRDAGGYAFEPLGG